MGVESVGVSGSGCTGFGVADAYVTDVDIAYSGISGGGIGDHNLVDVLLVVLWFWCCSK